MVAPARFFTKNETEQRITINVKRSQRRSENHRSQETYQQRQRQRQRQLQRQLLISYFPLLKS